MVEISIEVFGEKALNRELLRWGTRAQDASPAFVDIADLFYESEKKQFDSEGLWASGGWTPLKPATVSAKVNHPSWALEILQRTGAMKESLTSHDGGYSINVITPEFMEVGSKIPYGVYHQQPKGPGKGILPMRKPVELREQTKIEMVKILQAWIVGDL